MSALFYNLGIYFYQFLVFVASPFNKKAKQFYQGRKGLFLKIEKDLQDESRPVIWVHAASLGEFEQGRPVIEAIKEKKGDIAIVLTFFSPSGYEVRKNYEGADYIYYLPSDTPKNAKRFLELVKPKVALLIKYEFWRNYIEKCRVSGVYLASVSAIFRKEQLYFQSHSTFYADILKAIDYFFVQNELSGKLLESIDVDRFSVVGDTRFDRVQKIVEDAKDILIAERFSTPGKTFVLGSIWTSDMDVIADYLNSGKLRYILAPHNIKESDITSIEKYLTVPSIRYSKAEGVEDLSQYQVLIIDNMGMLSSLYRYGFGAYIGGAFRGALHNTLEAATWGKPVLFGKHKNNSKFHEAIELIQHSAALELDSKASFEQVMDRFLSSEEEVTKMGDAAKAHVEQNLGATAAIVDHVLTKIG